MPLDAFRKQALAATLPPPRERGASGFRLHAGAKSMLLFSCALGWLIRAFHKTEKRLQRDSRAATVRTSTVLSISHWKLIVAIHSTSLRTCLSFQGCQRLEFLK
jgi:hypothetical protein